MLKGYNEFIKHAYLQEMVWFETVQLVHRHLLELGATFGDDIRSSNDTLSSIQLFETVQRIKTTR
jgi:hypothetical protein